MKGSKAASSNDSGSSNNKSESHRIYWQQWPSATASSSGRCPPPAAASRRDLITSSAAIRISPNGAKAQDVTNLLCETLNLKSGADNSNAPPQESWDKVQDAWERDSLVLVGTLYSLPLHYVHFEHEWIEAQQQPKLQPLSSSSSSVASSQSGGKSQINKSDPPFHVVKTLSPTDNPPKIRDAMINHLQSLLDQSAAANPSRVTHSISPKLQWYFVPGINHPSSPIPSYIDLDGYSTSIEDESEDDDDDDDDNNGADTSEHDPDTNSVNSDHDIDPDDIISSLAASLQEKHVAEDTTSENQENSDKTPKKSMEERILRRERQRYFELSMCQSTFLHNCISGYLLKQSMSDPHVWKRVHCVLTDDHLWYISRIYTKPRSALNGTTDEHDNTEGSENENENDSDEESTTQQQQSEYFSFAKHRRLGLERALLIQPSSDRPSAPLYRTPFAFEVIAADGVPHRFRTTSPSLYKKWTEALSSRIVQSYENSLFEHAELIVQDETEARNKRFVSLVIEPLWTNQKNNLQFTTKNSHRHVAIDSPTMNILRFGIEVSEYRERCRHIQAILPAKHPVLALTDSSGEQANSNGHANGAADNLNGPTSNNNTSIRLDVPTQNMIKSAWDEAIRLGSTATKLAMSLHEEKGDKAKMPRSLETICQHLEYVITGDFRRPLMDPSGEKQAPPKPKHPPGRKNDKTRQFPPPIDLFDVLLAELQAVSATVTKQRLAKQRLSASSSRMSMDGSSGSGRSSSMNGGH